MLVKTDSNKTLKGHKLLIIAPWAPPVAFVEKLAAAVPDLQVVYHVQNWTSTPLPSITLPAGSWDDVTILMTFSMYFADSGRSPKAGIRAAAERGGESCARQAHV